MSTCTPVQVISTARTCNLILVVLDCLKPISHKKLIEHELEGFGIRLNKQPPGMTFRRKEKGGISFTTTLSNPRLDLDSEPILPSTAMPVLTLCSCVAAVGNSCKSAAGHPCAHLTGCMSPTPASSSTESPSRTAVPVLALC